LKLIYCQRPRARLCWRELPALFRLPRPRQAVREGDDEAERVKALVCSLMKLRVGLQQRITFVGVRARELGLEAGVVRVGVFLVVSARLAVVVCALRVMLVFGCPLVCGLVLRVLPRFAG
jgi:hypothetical protein